MSEFSEQAKLKACELANAQEPTSNWQLDQLDGSRFVPASMLALIALCQQVSDAAKASTEALVSVPHWHGQIAPRLVPFILPDPVDPLEEAVRVAVEATAARRIIPNDFLGHERKKMAPTYEQDGPKFLNTFRAELAKRGLKIVEDRS